MTFKEVAHFYIGCRCYLEEVNLVELTGFQKGNPVVTRVLKSGKLSVFGHDTVVVKDIFLLKPILRPLSDMTDIEVDEWNWIKPFPTEIKPFQGIKQSADRTAYLLSKHFDIFDLIESGEAIDKTKIK